MASRGGRFGPSRPAGDYYRSDDRRAPWPRRDQPLPPRPQTSTRDMYYFRGNDQQRPPQTTDSYRPSNNAPNRDAQRRYGAAENGRNGPENHNFSFRAGRVDGPRFEPAPRHLQRSNQRGKDQRNKPPGLTRHDWAKYKQTSYRPLLRSRRDVTPEQLAGMNGGHSRFIAANDVSDSEDEAMELDSDAAEELNGSLKNGLAGAAAMTDGVEPPSKRIRSALTGDSDSIPKWSNPDPYTSLPPPGESQAKKKDVVKLIRKAKVVSTRGDAQATSAENSDFISFDFGDDEPSNANISEDDDLAEAESLALTHSADDIGHSSMKNGKVALNTVSNSLPTTSPTAEPSMSTFLQVVESVPIDQWPPPPPEPAKAGSKRRFDDALGQLSIQDNTASKRRKEAVIDGSILSHWVAKSPETATPWCTVDHSSTERMGVWLHKEICDFYEYVKPRAFEETIRHGLLSRLKQFSQRHYPGHQVQCFGSFASGLYLPTADMDFVLMSPGYAAGGASLPRSRNWIRALAARLEQDGIAQRGSTESVLSAKVPIVKFVDGVTGLRGDISFENDSGIIANRTVQRWKEQCPAVPIIVTLVKQLLLMRGLNEVFTGGLGGFSITCLVMSMMQLHPALQSGNMNPLHHLGELLMTFFDLYGNNFNASMTGIRMEPPGYFAKHLQNRIQYNPRHIDRLSIIDPHRPDNDLSQGTTNIKLILQCFSSSYNTLQDRMARLHYSNLAARKGSSILGSIFGGDYTSFEQQRERLRRLHEQSVTSGQNIQLCQPQNMSPPDLPHLQPGGYTARQEVSRYGACRSERPPALEFDEKDASMAPSKSSAHVESTKDGGLTPRKSFAMRTGLSRTEIQSQLSRGEALRRDHPHIKNLPDMLTSEEFMCIREEIARSCSFKQRYPRLAGDLRVADRMTVARHNQLVALAKSRGLVGETLVKTTTRKAGLIAASGFAKETVDIQSRMRARGQSLKESYPHVTGLPEMATKADVKRIREELVGKRAPGQSLEREENVRKKSRGETLRLEYPHVEDLPAMLTREDLICIRMEIFRAISFKQRHPQLAGKMRVPDRLTLTHFNTLEHMAKLGLSSAEPGKGLEDVVKKSALEPASTFSADKENYRPANSPKHNVPSVCSASAAVKQPVRSELAFAGYPPSRLGTIPLHRTSSIDSQPFNHFTTGGMQLTQFKVAGSSVDDPMMVD